MPFLYSSQHKEIVGSVNDAPYTVSFDADGIAEVDQAVAEQLTSSENFGCSLVDEDGAFIDPSTLQSTPDTTEITDDANVLTDQTVATEEIVDATVTTEEIVTEKIDVPVIDTAKKGKAGKQGSDS